MNLTLRISDIFCQQDFTNIKLKNFLGEVSWLTPRLFSITVFSNIPKSDEKIHMHFEKSIN